MKKGQISIRNGIEDLLCPFTFVGISQPANGTFSHKGTMANDIGYKDPKNPYEPYYAPCHIKCIYVWKEYGQAMWQSINKVRFADGAIDYITFVTIHDNSLTAQIGTELKQGELMGHKGNKKANGVHAHIECSKGLYSVKDWKYNAYGNPSFPVEVNIDDVFFFDDTELSSNYIPSNYKIKYLKDVIVNQSTNVTPLPLKVGDKVKIIKTGNGSSFGTSNTAYGIGWEREILKIWEDRPYPYQVGNKTGTTGFYRIEALEKR